MSEHYQDEIEQAIEQIQAGEVESGLAQLQGLLAYADQDPDTAFQLADIFYELGHLDTASTLLDDVAPYFDEISTEMQIDIRSLRAEIKIDQGQLDDAMMELMHCLELEPDHMGSAVLLADLYLMQDLPEVACRYLEHVVAQHDDEPDVVFILSELYLDLGEWEKALVLFPKLVGTEYEDKITLSSANLLGQLGRFEEANRFYKQAMETDPDSDEAILGYAVTALQIDHFEEALQATDQLLERDPQHIGAYQLKGEVLQKDGRFDEAEAVYKQALAHKDHEEALYLNLIEVCYVQGKWAEAQKHLQSLLAIDDQHELAKEWQQRLDAATQS